MVQFLLETTIGTHGDMARHCDTTCQYGVQSSGTGRWEIMVTMVSLSTTGSNGPNLEKTRSERVQKNLLPVSFHSFHSFHFFHCQECHQTLELDYSVNTEYIRIVQSVSE